MAVTVGSGTATSGEDFAEWLARSRSPRDYVARGIHADADAGHVGRDRTRRVTVGGTTTVSGLSVTADGGDLVDASPTARCCCRTTSIAEDGGVRR